MYYQCYITFHLKENIYTLSYFLEALQDCVVSMCTTTVSQRSQEFRNFHDTFCSREQCPCPDSIVHCCLAVVIVMWCLKGVYLDNRIIWKGFGLLIPKQKKVMLIFRTQVNVMKTIVPYFWGFSVSYCEILI